MNALDFITYTFLKLTSKTCPFGMEDRFIEDVCQKMLPKNIKKDEWGNYYYKIGQSRTIFASHIDTVSREYVDVNHIIDGKLVKTDGTTTLGADDKAGMSIMLWMIENKIPGLYYFFIGEEVGCVGSGQAAKYGKLGGLYDRMISFDRRGTDSVITHQTSLRSCSDNFAQELATQLSTNSLRYKLDSGGVYTDSAEFVDIISECTNISVGYYNEHTFGESQDIEHLINLSEACLLVNWEELPTKRDPKVVDYLSYGIYGSRSNTYGVYSSKSTTYGSRTYGTYDDYDEDDELIRYNDDDYEEFDECSGYVGIDSDFSEYIGHSKSTKQAPREYYDENGFLVDITASKSRLKNTYDWISDKFLGDTLTKAELLIIKSHYLDMNDPNDEEFYDYLRTIAI